MMVKLIAIPDCQARLGSILFLTEEVLQNIRWYNNILSSREY